MAYSVGIDVTKKIIFELRDKYYVRFDAVILDMTTGLTETHNKVLEVTDNVNLSHSQVESLANTTIANYKVNLEKQ